MITITLCSRVTFGWVTGWQGGWQGGVGDRVTGWQGDIQIIVGQFAEHFRFFLLRSTFRKNFAPENSPQFFLPVEISGFLKNEHQLIHGSSAVRLAYIYIYILNEWVYVVDKKQYFITVTKNIKSEVSEQFISSRNFFGQIGSAWIGWTILTYSQVFTSFRTTPTSFKIVQLFGLADLNGKFVVLGPRAFLLFGHACSQIQAGDESYKETFYVKAAQRVTVIRRKTLKDVMKCHPFWYFLIHFWNVEHHFVPLLFCIVSAVKFKTPFPK